MLFNSDEFILGFLPVTFLGFYLLRDASRDWAIRWIIAASLFFYAWWRPLNVFIIAPSIIINYSLAKALLKLGEDDKNERLSQFILFLGVAFNIAFLGYFKYKNFLGSTINDIFGTNFIFDQIILPLGISFITFQKIAFLVDVQAGRIKSFTLQDYCLFVLFFPQLVAGPIVHYSEMMPQFKGSNFRVDEKNIAVGATLFFAGLFKKVVFADTLASYVTPIYADSANGGVTLISAWIAAIGFTLQLYFDFSGYTDMALGSARLFGIRLPVNFDSPLQAASIIEFWQRWHMTLTRFLTAYIYNPLVLRATRRKLVKGIYNTTATTFLDLVAFPTLLTMLVSGLWHGAGYTFLVWGFLHGCYLTANHAWRLSTQKIKAEWTSYQGLLTTASVTLTFLCVAVSMVFFRSPTIHSSLNILSGMIGLNGVSLPHSLLSASGAIGKHLTESGIKPDTQTVHDFIAMLALVLALLVVAMVAPNTLQILDGQEPALGVKPNRATWFTRRIPIKWSISLRWAIVVSIAAVAGIVSLGNYSEFLYWQF